MPPQLARLLPALPTLEEAPPDPAWAGCAQQAAFARELLAQHASARLCLHLYQHHRFATSSSSATCSSQQQEVGEGERVVLPKTVSYRARQ
jgi:hypothetical protein